MVDIWSAWGNQSYSWNRYIRPHDLHALRLSPVHTAWIHISLDFRMPPTFIWIWWITIRRMRRRHAVVAGFFLFSSHLDGWKFSLIHFLVNNKPEDTPWHLKKRIPAGVQTFGVGKIAYHGFPSTIHFFSLKSLIPSINPDWIRFIVHR